MNQQAKRVYLDHAATTPIDPQVAAAFFDAHEHYHNPGGLYRESGKSQELLSQARSSIAGNLSCHSDEIIFTRGGTESCNMAIVGVVKSYFRNQREHSGSCAVPHIVISNVEHPAVRNTVYMLARQGSITMDEIAVDKTGRVNIDDLYRAITSSTVLVCIMYAQNEIGVIQDIHGCAKTVRRWKKHHQSDMYPLVYCDAIQATNYCDMNVQGLGVDMLSISGSKIYAPKNSACLYVRRSTPIDPLYFGGNQQNGMRPGTESVPEAVALAMALEKAVNGAHTETQRLQLLQHEVYQWLERTMPDVTVTGSIDYRLPNNIHIRIPTIDGERLVIELDARGYAVSARSSCSSNDDVPSHVIQAVYRDDHTSLDDGYLRITMGRDTTKKDIMNCMQECYKIITTIRTYALDD